MFTHTPDAVALIVPIFLMRQLGHPRPHRWYVSELEFEARDSALESLSLSTARGFLSVNGRKSIGGGCGHPGLGVKAFKVFSWLSRPTRWEIWDTLINLFEAVSSK